MNIKPWLKFILCTILIFSFMPFNAHGSEVAISEPNIAAEAAIVIDATTKTVLYEKNAYDKHYPASITKLMTALLAIENLSPNDTITFSNEAIFGIERGSSHIGLDVGEQITVDEALHGLLLMSANEVANGLAEAVSGSISGFAELMTEKAKELGALNTNFVNPHGLHDDNHYTTAYDMALIGSYLAENDYFLQIMKDYTYEIPPTNKVNEIRYLSQQHKMVNPLRDANIYREDVIGGKTGYTDQARHTLVTMAKEGDTTLVAVVLQSEKDTLYSDTNQLLDYGFKYYHSVTLQTADDIIKTLPVYDLISGQSYQSANCGLGVKEDVLVTLPYHTSSDDIIMSFELPNELDSQVQVGDEIGKVSFLLDSKLLGTASVVVNQIDNLPQPELTFYTKLPLSSWKIGILVAIIIILLLIFFIMIRQRNRRKKRYLKMNKLFK